MVFIKEPLLFLLGKHNGNIHKTDMKLETNRHFANLYKLRGIWSDVPQI